MVTLIMIIIMFILCMVLYKPGIVFFLFWMGVCAAVFHFIDVYAGLLGAVSYFIAISGNSGGIFPTISDIIPDLTASHAQSDIPYNAYSGSSYHSGGDITRLPNGNTATRYGDNTYLSNHIRTLHQGTITYYFDSQTDQRLGYSIDRENGICNYFDDNGREIGYSNTNGSVTNYYGDCFECR